MFHFDLPVHHPAWPMTCPQCGKVVEGSQIIWRYGDKEEIGRHEMMGGPCFSACQECKVIGFNESPDDQWKRIIADIIFREWHGMMREFRIVWPSSRVNNPAPTP